MALGVDQWAAEICTDLKIPWIAAIPFEGQEKAWPQHSQTKYHNLLKSAYSIQIVGGQDTVSKMLQNRNEWMVDNSGLLLAVWDGSSGGTCNCVTYAKLIGRRILTLNPKDK